MSVAVQQEFKVALSYAVIQSQGYTDPVSKSSILPLLPQLPHYPKQQVPESRDLPVLIGIRECPSVPNHRPTLTGETLEKEKIL